VTDELALSAALTEVALATTGVVAVYPPGSLARAAARQVVALTADVAADSARVAVSRDSSGALTIVVNVGVAGDHAVPDTLRAVADAVRLHLAEADPLAPTPQVEVRASSIDAPA
jgi:hypothetical protein